jgi:hypothetical protein
LCRRGGVGAQVTRFARAIVAAVALGAEVRAVSPSVIAPWGLFGRPRFAGASRLVAWLTGGVAERFAFPILLNASRRFRRKDLQFGLGFCNGGFDRR